MWPFSKKVLDAKGKVTDCDGVTVGIGIYDMDIVTMSAKEAMRLRFPHIGILRSKASIVIFAVRTSRLPSTKTAW